jgi:ubiquinone/menaquinone biosynthesis C-methylase UbiE
MNLLNEGDFLELLTKLKQRGISYFLSKIIPDAKKRTQSTFSTPKTAGSNWWIIPDVKQRENEKISGDSEKTFDQYLADHYFQNKKKLRLLSIACGVGNREIKLAESGHFEEVVGIDLSSDLIMEASRKVKERNLQNISFKQADFYSFKLNEREFDVVLFHMALHHFKNIDGIAQRVRHTLKDDGILILNEYVGKNRLQFTASQVCHMNRLLGYIPERYRKRYLTGITKKKVYAPGLLRMIISDPSESVESATILPAIHKYFKVVEEKNIGGDLLMMVLKDIAHHFISHNDTEGKKILEKLFEEEDQYLLESEKADFIFGIYQKKK